MPVGVANCYFVHLSHFYFCFVSSFQLENETNCIYVSAMVLKSCAVLNVVYTHIQFPSYLFRRYVDLVLSVYNSNPTCFLFFLFRFRVF